MNDKLHNNDKSPENQEQDQSLKAITSEKSRRLPKVDPSKTIPFIEGGDSRQRP